MPIGTAYTIQVTRTTEIEVSLTVYFQHGELEIVGAIDCDTGEPIELTEYEADTINETAMTEFVQGLADAEADAKEDQRKIDQCDER